MRTSFFSFLTRFLVFLLASAAPPVAHALDPQMGLSSYRHERWGEVDGAPGLIDAMAQTEDGWLWLASRHAGLYRFDGVRFIPYTTGDGSRLQNVGISAMQAGSNNSLWIGHGLGGVSVLRGHRLHHILTPDMTASVFAIARARDDSMWVASGRGLFHIRKDKVARIDAAGGYASKRSEYVMADSQGRVWASDGVHLYVLEAGNTVFRLVRKVEINPMMIEAPDGSVWLVLGKRFERLTSASASPQTSRSSGASSYQSGFDKDGNLWSGNCPLGLCVVRPGSWKDESGFNALSSTERFDQAWQMTSLRVLSVFIDRENNLWVGTAAGVDRLRDQPVHMIEELTDRGPAHALPHPDGRIVVLETQRLNGVHVMWNIVDGKLVSRENRLDAQMMARAPDGSLVLAGARGIERQYAANRRSIPMPPISFSPGKTIRFTNLAAGNDELWVRISGHGTWRFHGGEWSQFNSKDADRVHVALDRSGRSYIGGGSRLSVVVGHDLQEIRTEDAGVGTIHAIHAAEEVLVSGTEGIGLVKNRRLHPIRLSASKQISKISGLAKGPGGVYWLNSPQGLLRISAEDWGRTMRDPTILLKAELFDALDGYLGGGPSMWLNDTAFLAKDGRLWLASERGLAWMEPGALRANPVAANVEILGVISNGRHYVPGSRITLSDGAQDIQITYSSPSLRIPQRVQFRYRMAGTEQQWVDAGTRRTAYYQNLAPGAYTFEVMALNESGVRSPQLSTLAFQITPHFTQTWWFYSLCAAFATAILLLVYRMRMRHLAARLEERFEIRASERESIARALHDTFLQSLQGLFFSMQAVMSRLPPNSPARVEFGTLLERARRVLAEGRDEVKGLRSEFESSEQFWQVLQRDLTVIIPEACTRVDITGPEGIEALQPQIHHNVYAVVREAVVNALRHTSGTVFVHTAIDPKEFVLSVTDSGPGLGPYKTGRKGHFGVQGMREHAAQIGGRLDIDDVEAGGTRVTLLVPGRLAYLTQEKALKAG